MSGIQSLFANEPSLPNVQTHTMPDNPERWAEALTTFLKEQYPDVAKLPLSVEYRKRDEKTATAIGAIHVGSEEAKKEVLVPFVIKDSELSPMDIWMEPKTHAAHPLTKDTFKEVFFVQSPAEGLDARPADGTGTYFNDPSLWTTNYPPLQGRYSYASAGYEILDVIADTMTADDAAVFINTLKENPHLVPKFQKHGHADLIKKLAQKTYPNSNDYLSAAMQLIPTAAVSVKKDGPDKYSILSSVEGIYDTAQVVKMDYSSCEKFLSTIVGTPQDVLHEVDAEGEKLLIIRKPAPGVFLYDATEAGPEDAKDFAVYRVKTKTGLQADGVVIPRVVNFAGNKKPYKLFISKTHSSFQPSIAGIRLMDIDDKDPCKKILEPRDVRVGQTGTFVYIEHGKALATEPVTIKAIEQYGPMTVCDLNGKTFSVRRGYGNYFTKEEKEDGKDIAVNPSMSGMKQAPKKRYLDAHGMLEVRKDIFVIPEKMMWVPMDGLNDVTSTGAEWIQKEAASKLEIDPLSVQWTGIVFDINGAGLPKMAMKEQELKLLLATCGADHEKIASIVKRAKFMGRAKVHGTDRLKAKASKVSEVGKLVAKIATAVGSLKRNLIKEAAEMPEDAKATVDVLLGLNFLNADNLSRFVAYKPVFEKVLDYLAELTLASRLGLKDVPEAAAVTAMTKLMEVCDGLHKLQASAKRPSTKTAAALPLVKGKKYLPSKKGKLIAAVGG